MKKLNWDQTCHAVVDVCSNSNIMDMHTHGLAEDIGIELQYVLYGGDECIEEIEYLFSVVAFKILNDELNIDNEEPFEIEDWEDCQFEFYKTKDSEGEDILRIIECDMNGKFPDEEDCSDLFCLQVEDIYNI